MSALITASDLQRAIGKSLRQCYRIIYDADPVYRAGNGRGRGGRQLSVDIRSLPMWIQSEIRKQDDLDSDTKRKLDILASGFKLEESGDKSALQRLCRDHDISLATYRRWRRRYNADGIDGLKPTLGAPEKVLTQEVKTFIVDCWNQQSRPTVSKVVRRTEAFCIDNDLEPVSRYMIQKVIDAIPEPAKLLGREGKRASRERHGFYVERDWPKIPVNRLWCSDHRQFDVFVFRTPESDKPMRPWLTVWEDLRTRTITGWNICLKPNGDSVGVSLQHGISRFGLPDDIYIDNGKDYTSYYFSGHQSSRFKVDFDARRKQSIAGRLGLKVHHALPYHPQSKPVESFFKFVSLDFDPDLPGWCGRDNNQKPEKLAFEIEQRALLTFDELKAEFEKWVEHYNNQRTHSAIKCAPASLYEGARVRRTDAFTLETLLWKREKKSIQRRGFRLLNEWYWHDDLTDLKWEGKYFTVIYNPDDVSHVHVFDEEEREHLCVAYPLDKVLPLGTSEADMAKLKQIQKRERELADQYLKSRQHPTMPEEVLERVRSGRDQATASTPLPDNVYTIVTQQSRTAKQMLDAEKNVEVREHRRTGTDDFPILGIQPEQGPNKDIPILGIKPSGTKAKDFPLVYKRKE